ncbi:FkbM family methyltransferase [Mycolicibacterium frederiksbergense]|uniref:FkbM family methyltransferase n=1 Tax=Mycolicibacterium frederiksbergense TaxID=117567 RepID=UPI00399A4442
MRLLARIQQLAHALPVHSLRARLLVYRELRNGEAELKLVPILADGGKDFLDVGANQGVYAFRAMGHYRKVIAVEAHPGLVAGLRRIIRRDNEVLAVALSDEVGETSLHIPTLRGRDVDTRSSLLPTANPGFDLRTVTVPTTTIDALGLRRIGVIKIDVEGHELAVLRGAAETLRTAKPTCIVETAERHTPGGVAQTFTFFESMGYDGYFLHRGKLRDGTHFAINRFQRPEDRKAVGGRRSADYVNNFIFIHRENDSHLPRIRAALEKA